MNNLVPRFVTYPTINNIPDTSLVLFRGGRQGPNDRDIEIYLNSVWTRCPVSRVLPGDFWQVLNSDGSVREDSCYQCVSPPKLSYPYVRPDSPRGYPTISMGVNHVLTRPQFYALTQCIAAESLVLKEPKNLSTNIEDVDFKEHP